MQLLCVCNNQIILSAHFLLILTLPCPIGWWTGWQLSCASFGWFIVRSAIQVGYKVIEYKIITLLWIKEQKHTVRRKPAHFPVIWTYSIYCIARFSIRNWVSYHWDFPSFYSYYNRSFPSGLGKRDDPQIPRLASIIFCLCIGILSIVISLDFNPYWNGLGTSWLKWCVRETLNKDSQRNIIQEKEKLSKVFAFPDRKGPDLNLHFLTSNSDRSYLFPEKGQI